MSNSNAKERHKFWQDIMENYERSGLKRKEFCDKNNLSLNKFRNWRFRIRKGHKTNRKKVSVDNKFIPLVINDKPTANEIISNHIIELKLGTSGDINICIPSQFNPEALSNLLVILRKIGC